MKTSTVKKSSGLESGIFVIRGAPQKISAAETTVSQKRITKAVPKYFFRASALFAPSRIRTEPRPRSAKMEKRADRLTASAKRPRTSAPQTQGGKEEHAAAQDAHAYLARRKPEGIFEHYLPDAVIFKKKAFYPFSRKSDHII